mmetsp:Transcript_10031/g.30905  ORF Transcript_10031/g.30905 Transcript_10031/m.30905 type:complete len:234 (+) Transcript_10031:318-1019(+)
MDHADPHGARDAGNHQHAEHHQDLTVGDVVDPRHLRCFSSAVFHQFRFRPGEHHDTDRLLSVSKVCSSQQYVVGAQRYLELPRFFVVPIEVVESVVGQLANNAPRHRIGVVGIEHLVDSASSFANFKVCFAIKICRLDVAHSFGQRAPNEDEVGRERRVVVHFHDLTHFQIAPLHLFPLSRPPNHHFPTVQLGVAAMALHVLVRVFRHRHHQNHRQRNECCETARGRNSGNDL